MLCLDFRPQIWERILNKCRCHALAFYFLSSWGPSSTVYNKWMQGNFCIYIISGNWLYLKSYLTLCSCISALWRYLDLVKGTKNTPTNLFLDVQSQAVMALAISQGNIWHIAGIQCLMCLPSLPIVHLLCKLWVHLQSWSRLFVFFPLLCLCTLPLAEAVKVVNLIWIVYVLYHAHFSRARL